MPRPVLADLPRLLRAVVGRIIGREPDLPVVDAEAGEQGSGPEERPGS